MTEPYSLEAYGRLLEALTAAGYVFQPFTLDRCTGRSVFLRHDVDYSLDCALAMARVNAAKGAAATFFIRPRATLYNIAAPPGRDALRRLVGEFGQRVALHLSLDSETLTSAEVDSRLGEDLALLRTACPETQAVFSWHNPGLAFERDATLMRRTFPAAINAYGSFAGGLHPYFADSNLRYTVAELHALIDRDLPVFQLNLHPFQWCFGKDDMAAVIAAVLTQKLRETLPELGFNYVFREKWQGVLPEETLRRVEETLLAPARRSAREPR